MENENGKIIINVEQKSITLYLGCIQWNGILMKWNGIKW